MIKNNENAKMQLYAVLIGIILLVAKFIAFFITNSNSILTDALESIINVVAGLITLYSLIIAARPKDKNHPYGHGKVEFISASFEGTLILAAGFVIIFKSVYNFFIPHTISSLDIGIYLTGIAGLINYAVGEYIEIKGKKSKSLALIAGGKHLKSDAYSSAGMIVGLIILYYTQQIWLDNVIAIIFGFLIAKTGVSIIRKSLAGIMDEADYEILSDVIEFVNKNRSQKWIDIHNMRIIKFGTNLHVDCHLTLPWYYTLEESHEEVTEFENLIMSHESSTTEFFIHTDPCMPISCTVCQISECKVRQKSFGKKIEWQLENVIVDAKHKVD